MLVGICTFKIFIFCSQGTKPLRLYWETERRLRGPKCSVFRILLQMLQRIHQLLCINTDTFSFIKLKKCIRIEKLTYSHELLFINIMKACGTGLVFSEARGYCDYCASVSPCNANPSNILCPASQPCVKCPSSLPTQTTCSCLGPANCPTSCSIQALGN